MPQAHLPRFAAPRRILVPVDLSPISFQALGAARRLGGPRCRIKLFYVQDPVIQGEEVPLNDPVATRRLLARDRRTLARLEGKGVEAEAIEGKDTTEASIAAAARKFKADLIVMTTHGRGGLSRFMAGSMAQRLIHTYDGPLFLLRPKRHAKA